MVMTDKGFCEFTLQNVTAHDSNDDDIAQNIMFDPTCLCQPVKELHTQDGGWNWFGYSLCDLISYKKKWNAKMIIHQNDYNC